MAERITATDAARNLSDFLNRVRYKGESFLITRNGEEVGMLSPIATGSPKTVGHLLALLERGFPDEQFAADLEEIRREQPPLPEDPWESRPC